MLLMVDGGLTDGRERWHGMACCEHGVTVVERGKVC